MELSEKVAIAQKAVRKGWDFDDLHYGDDLYGREDQADSIWNLVLESRSIGSVNFAHKYKVKP